MKTRKERVVEYKTIYVSDDGLFKSEDQEKVREYELNISKKSFKPVLKIKPSLLEYDSDIEVYRCDSREEYLDFISFCSEKYRDKDNLRSARGKYNPAFKYYAVTEAYGSSDFHTDFILLPLLDISCKMKWRVKEVGENLNQLEEQLGEVKKLLEEEER